MSGKKEKAINQRRPAAGLFLMQHLPDRFKDDRHYRRGE
jgi:hypothetical protein